MSTATKIGAGVALALILLFSAGAAGGLYGRFSQTNAARANNKATWHKVICHIERETLKSSDSKASKLNSLKFFDRILVEDVNTAPCGLQGGIK